MSHYRSNLRDLEFTLFEVLGVGTTLGAGTFAELDEATARQILAEVERLATGPIAASYVSSDRNPPVYDPATYSVTMPEPFKASYQAYMDAEWWRLDVPPEAGGTACPRSLWWALMELIQGAQAAVYMFSGGPGFGGLLHRMGTPDQQRIAEIMIEKHWGATMVLTEPDAGSDVGAGRTTARRQDDGSWHVSGVKRFITSGEHDLADNIMHFVLARPEGHGPGTKGLSMFLVPKFHFDTVTGELGERNGVYATNVETKMGLKVSTTCELTFGANEPAVGWLVGEEHDGIAQMFKVIESARMQVGVKAIGTLSTGYLNALDYARERVQGPDLIARTDKTAPRVTIDQHPDVRRMLMMQKAYAEGLRAVYLYTADWLDRATRARDSGDDDTLATSVNDLLLPIVKGVGSERAHEQLTAALQTLGGSGFLQDYPIEQYIRDTKIDTLYEGTTGIQGMDFFFRKIARDNRVAFDTVAAEIDASLASIEYDERFKAEHAAVTDALSEVRAMVTTMCTWDADAAQSEAEVYRVGQNTTRLLMSVGDLLCGWLLLRQAVVAQAALDAASTGAGGGRAAAGVRSAGTPAGRAAKASGTETAYYTGKVAVARFFAASVLPELAARRRVVEDTDNALMGVPAEAF